MNILRFFELFLAVVYIRCWLGYSIIVSVIEPNTNDSTSGVFNNNNALPPEECHETPVPSVVVYTQLNAE
jgi:hypothetical protein